ncbi:MAG: DNA polymerase III subunit [Verrucomicrobia bacterium]|nr:DNA polymerase III subunit [Verrucomicrobiota bacterium]
MSFSDFSEQKQVVKLLQRSLARDRLSHAYLFTGSDLTELESMASTLAKTLNCRNPAQKSPEGISLDSCDQCANCTRIDRRIHPDIHFVRSESKSRVILIDQIRDLLQAVYLKPSEAFKKVAVIVAADRLNMQAANAFLKTLEEPPSNSIVILLSTDPQRILETLLSRCLRLNFESEPLRRLAQVHGDWLKRFGTVAASEEKGLFGRYHLLSLIMSRLADVKSDAEKGISARSPLQQHDEIEPKLRERWENELAASIEAEYRRERSDVLLTMQWWLRDVWLKANSCDRMMMAFPSMEAETAAVAGRISPDDCLMNIETVETVQRMLNTNVQEALAFEVSFLKLKF